MPKGFPNKAKIEWAESKLGPRGSAVIDWRSRALIRSWIQGKLQVPYAQISHLSVPSMSAAYNDTTDALLPGLLTGPVTKAEVKPVPAVKEDAKAHKFKIGDKIHVMQSAGGYYWADDALIGKDTVHVIYELKDDCIYNNLPCYRARMSNGINYSLCEPQIELAVQPKPEETKEMPTTKEPQTEDMAKALTEVLAKFGAKGADESRIREIAAEEAAKVKVPDRIVVIERKDDKEERRDVGIQHKAFPLLLKILDAGLHVALVGPAGTGKTTAAHNVARALERAYECQSFSGTTTKSDLLGFIDANGNYRDTPFRRAFCNGGVWVGDEFDAGNANANVVINAATANGVCSFPDGMKTRHEKFAAVICMNTYGQGANRQYVGRNQLDAATLDRFAFLEWATDESLEASMVGVTAAQETLDIGLGGILKPKAWLDRVCKVRAQVDKAGVRHLVTPRATMFGAKLFAAGVGRTHVEELVLWRGLDKEQRARVEKA